MLKELPNTNTRLYHYIIVGIVHPGLSEVRKKILKENLLKVEQKSKQNAIKNHFQADFQPCKEAASPPLDSQPSECWTNPLYCYIMPIGRT